MGKSRFDEDTSEFLDALDVSTRKVYQAGLLAFQTFYKQSPKHFLDAIEEDFQKPRRERRRVARRTLKGFVEWLKRKGKKPKTIRAYVSAVQSLAGYYDIHISTRYVDMPASNPYSQKYPWTLEKIAEFVGMIKKPQLQSFAVTIFQSGLSISDALALTYNAIKLEYEQGIIPLCLDLARIKTDVPFMTFIGKWGVSLLQHLANKKLTLDTPLYDLSKRTIDHHFQQLAKKFIGKYKGRNPCRPHSLRAAFRTLLGDAGCDRDVVKFWMGQRLPEQDRVYHSRSREGWRRLYARYEHALTPKNWEKI